MAPPMRLVTGSIGLLLCGVSSAALAHGLEYRLTDRAFVGLVSISFFAAVVLVCAATIRRLWNGLRRDFPRMPMLGFWRALALVLGLSAVFNAVLFCATGPGRYMTIGGWEVGSVSVGLLGQDDGPPRRMTLE